jgi:hypothetical protein
LDVYSVVECAILRGHIWIPLISQRLILSAKLCLSEVQHKGALHIFRRLNQLHSLLVQWCARVGNGRSAREDGNEVFLLGITRWVAVPTPRDELASGEEMAGRDIVMVAEKNLLVIGCKSI